MQYRWFGVVWYDRDNSQVVVDYRFEDSKESLDQWLRKQRWDDINRVPNQASQLYRSLRSQQQSRDWTYQEQMPFYTVFKNPWKNVARGWYVICSGNEYPFLATAVERKKFTVWVHHHYICENEHDLNTFISRVNEEWEITLQKLSNI